jgi:outer membrane receptor protein involved in Fe transport
MSKLKLSALHLAIGTSLLTGLAFNASAAVENSAEEVERIEVTGSRIKRTDLESAVPITSITRSDIVQVGALNVADLLNTSPVSIAGSDQSNTAFTGSTVGLNTTQLRGLGSARTLILVNGRRFVSGMSPSVGYAVDLNAIPTSMIQRIDILKSASSAIYGSDAVAGVINIITRKDFEGVELNAQSGISAESDREKYSINITAGNNWDTGHATIAIGFDDDKGLKSSDRDFSKEDEAILLDDNGQEYRSTVYSSYPPGARVGSYNGDGTPFDFASTPEGDRFNRAGYRQLVTPVERKYMAMNLSQEMNESVTYFAEVNWNSSSTYNSTIEPTPMNVNDDVWFRDKGGLGGLSIYSPLVPELLRTNLEADGITNLNETTFVRRMVEFGARSTDVDRDTIRVATGFDWDIDGNWALNTYLTWGKTSQNQENGGQVNVERAALALDVEINPETGAMQCASADARLQGCVPLEILGVGTMSDAAVAYVKSPATVQSEAEQFVVAASVTGELPIELSGGNIGVAFGVEHRLEKGTHTPGSLAQVGSTSSNKSAPTDGSFYSNDIFAEAVIPVLDNLTLDLAARYSDHEIVGGQTTWNLGAEYSPIETLKLRASAATAIRTPNIADLFGGKGETFAGVTDPCNGITATDTSVEATNCLSIASIADRIATSENGAFELTQIEAQSTGGSTGGNQDVKEETADTYSVGFVWHVTDGLAMTVDYYDIAIEDAIDTTSRTTVLNRCFAVSPGEFDASCAGNAVRDPKGALTEVNSATSNENNIDTSGVDLEVSYSMDLGAGTFATNFIWNHTIEYVQTGILDGRAVDYAGEVLNPENRANLNLSYTMDDLSVSWRMRYWDESVDSVDGDNYNFSNFEPLTDFNNFDAVVYHDISGTYFMTDSTTVTVSVQNLFDKEPQFAGQGFFNGGTGINTVSEAYDVTGRYLQANVTVKF